MSEGGITWRKIIWFNECCFLLITKDPGAELNPVLSRIILRLPYIRYA